MDHIITRYCVPDCIILDQRSAFMASLVKYLFNKLDTFRYKKINKDGSSL